MSGLSRRRFLRGVGGSAGLITAGGLLSSPVLAQSQRIRHFWWGNPDRDRRTFEAIELFNAAHADIDVVGETLGFADYFTRLTTQIAGGNMADVFQMGLGVMQEYIDRNTILPLDEFVGDTIDLSDMDQSAIDACTFDGQLFGLSIGANTLVTVYNTRIFEEAGIAVDSVRLSYDELHEVARQISEATPDGIYGTDDATWDWTSFGTYLTQRGFPDNYNEEGLFAFDQSHLEDYWNMWREMRDSGATPSGAETAGLVAPEMSNMGIVSGLTAITFAWSNQMVGIQALTQDRLGALMRPHLEDGAAGQSIQPSQLICLSRDAVDRRAATTYMNAFVNDPEMTMVLGLERGIPSVGNVRDALEPTLSEVDQTAVTYFDAIQPYVAPLGPPQPAGNREVGDAFERLSVNVLLDRQSIADTAAQFMREGEAILRRTR